MAAADHLLKPLLPPAHPAHRKPVLPLEDLDLFFRALNSSTSAAIATEATAAYGQQSLGSAAAGARLAPSPWAPDGNMLAATQSSMHSLGGHGSPPAYMHADTAGAAASSFLYPATPSPVYVPTTRAVLPQYGGGGSGVVSSTPSAHQPPASSVWPPPLQSSPETPSAYGSGAPHRFGPYSSNPSPPGLQTHMGRSGPATDGLGSPLHARSAASTGLSSYGYMHSGDPLQAAWSGLNASGMLHGQQTSPLRRSSLGQYMHPLSDRHIVHLTSSFPVQYCLVTSRQ